MNSLRTRKFIISGKSRINLIFGYSLLNLDNDLKERNQLDVEGISPYIFIIPYRQYHCQ
ncbi:MAG: hypothetical protein AAB509_03425 [Patescibacteria group bacterium]